MRLATWNVNSAKARLPRLLDWLDTRRRLADVETRMVAVLDELDLTHWKRHGGDLSGTPYEELWRRA